MTFKSKTCIRCNTEKPRYMFSPNYRMADGYLNRCKTCQNEISRDKYRNDVRYRVNCIWNALMQRIENADGKNPSYAATELRMTKDEFIDWAVPEYKLFIRNSPEKRPSIDRIDDAGHYELSNLQVIDWGDNARKARRNINVHGPDGMWWCSKCKSYKETHCFYIEKDGLSCFGHCKSCRSIDKRDQRIRNRIKNEVR